MASRLLDASILSVLVLGAAPALAQDPPPAPAPPAVPGPPPRIAPAAPAAPATPYPPGAYPQPGGTYPQPYPYPPPAQPYPYPPPAQPYPYPPPAQPYAQPYPQPYPYAQPAPYPQQPWSAPPARPTTERRSVGAMVTGITALSVGAIMAGSAAAYLHHGDQTCSTDGSGFSCSTPGLGTGVIALFVVGLAQAVIGIPLIIYGAPHVPTAADTGKLERSRWAGAPAGQGWGWSF